jgi:hypothetical protein
LNENEIKSLKIIVLYKGRERVWGNIYSIRYETKTQTRKNNNKNNKIGKTILNKGEKKESYA